MFRIPQEKSNFAWLKNGVMVVPTEVKAEENVKSKSLSLFIKEDFKNLNLKGLRCSMKPYIDQGWMENIPLYAVEEFLKRK